MPGRVERSFSLATLGGKVTAGWVGRERKSSGSLLGNNSCCSEGKRSQQGDLPLGIPPPPNVQDQEVFAFLLLSLPFPGTLIITHVSLKGL